MYTFMWIYFEPFGMIFETSTLHCTRFFSRGDHTTQVLCWALCEALQRARDRSGWGFGNCISLCPLMVEQSAMENCPFSSMIWLLRMVIFHCKQLKVQGTLHRIRWKEAAPDPLDSDFVEAIPRFLGHPAGYESWSDKAPTLNPVPPRKSYFWGFNTVLLVVVSYIKQDNFARFVRVDKHKLLSISAEVPLEVQSIRAQRTLLGSLELQPGTMERPWKFTRCGWAKMG